MATIDMTVNGRRESIVADPQAPLLTVLRNDLGLHGPKFGCGLGQCGACTVHMDGVAIRSCATPVASAQGTRITYAVEASGPGSDEVGPMVSGDFPDVLQALRTLVERG